MVNTVMSVTFAIIIVVIVAVTKKGHTVCVGRESTASVDRAREIKRRHRVELLG